MGKSWLQKRSQLGIYDTLWREFRQPEKEQGNFDELLALMQNDIAKKDSVMSESVKTFCCAIFFSKI